MAKGTYLELPDEVREHLQMLAVERNCSMKDVASRAIEQQWHEQRATKDGFLKYTRVWVTPEVASAIKVLADAIDA